AIRLLFARLYGYRCALLRRARRRRTHDGEHGADRDRALHRLSPGSKFTGQSPASGGGGSGLALASPRKTPSSYHGFPDFFVMRGVPTILPAASSVTITRVASGCVRKPGGTIQIPRILRFTRACHASTSGESASPVPSDGSPVRAAPAGSTGGLGGGGRGAACGSDPRRSASRSSRFFSCFFGGSLKTSFCGFGFGFSFGFGAVCFSGSTIAFGSGGGGGGGGAGTASGGGAGAGGAGAGAGFAAGAGGAGAMSSTAITCGGSRSRMLGDTKARPSAPAWTRADHTTMRRNSRRAGGTPPPF